MTVILFLVDTSASMGQRSYLGTSLLDSARYAVEYFLKSRSKDPNSRNDRYMLLTFDEFPKNIKVGWRENQSVLSEQLRRLSASARRLSNVAAALGDTFRILHLNRAASGVDQFGHGRYPYYLEPATIICITDGGLVSTKEGLCNQVSIVPPREHCGDLYAEPFRWDQRLFSLVLRLPAHQPLAAGSSRLPAVPLPLPPVDGGPLEAMCAATAGRSYAVCTPRQIYAAVDNIVARLHNVGVMLWLERVGPPPPATQPQAQQQLDHNDNDDNAALKPAKPLTNGIMENGVVAAAVKPPVDAELRAHNGDGAAAGAALSSDKAGASWHRVLTCMLVKHFKSAAGHWPIPEEFWPDVTAGRLPPRPAHPLLRYACADSAPHTFMDLPFDKYELEHSPLAQYILARRQPNACWQLFVAGSSRYDALGAPFGYIKASAAMHALTLYIMPYNYPVLLALLGELRDTLKMKITNGWRKRFDNYVSNTLPIYYYVPLRKALARLNLHNLMDAYKQDTPNSQRVQNELLRATQLSKGHIDTLQRELSDRLLLEQQREQTEEECWTELRRSTVDKTLSSLYGASVDAYNRPLAHTSATGGCVAEQYDSGEHANLRVRMAPVSVSQSRPHPAGSGSGGVQPATHYANAFDVPRGRLLDTLAKMRLNVAQLCAPLLQPMLQAGIGTMTLADAEDLHVLPVSRMGLYQDYLRRMNDRGKGALRNVEGTAAPRLHADFGNPYKVDKQRSAMPVDEADVDKDPLGENAANGGGGSGRQEQGAGAAAVAHRKAAIDAKRGMMAHRAGGGRRKRGPLPSAFRWRPRAHSKQQQESQEGAAWETQSALAGGTAGGAPASALGGGDKAAAADDSTDDDDRLSIASEPTMHNGTMDSGRSPPADGGGACTRAEVDGVSSARPAASGAAAAGRIDADTMLAAHGYMLTTLRRPANLGSARACTVAAGRLCASPADRRALWRRAARDADRFKRAALALHCRTAGRADAEAAGDTAPPPSKAAKLDG